MHHNISKSSRVMVKKGKKGGMGEEKGPREGEAADLFNGISLVLVGLIHIIPPRSSSRLGRSTAWPCRRSGGRGSTMTCPDLILPMPLLSHLSMQHWCKEAEGSGPDVRSVAQPRRPEFGIVSWGAPDHVLMQAMAEC